MQVIIEKAVDDPDSTDRTKIYGVSDYTVSLDGTPTTTLWWPYFSPVSNEETTIKGQPVSGVDIHEFDFQSLVDSILDDSYAANTVLVYGAEYRPVEGVIGELTEEEKQNICIITENDDLPTTNIDFFNTTSE